MTIFGYGGDPKAAQVSPKLKVDLKKLGPVNRVIY